MEPDSTTHSSRLTAFKKTITVADSRRKRAELSVSLRKQARDEQLLKRRAMSPDSDEDPTAVPLDKLPPPEEIVQGLKSGNLPEMTMSARAARRMLSREQNPPIDMMLNAGLLAPLVNALDRNDCSDLQFEAAWAITNIASGTHAHTLAVVDAGAVPKLVGLLSQSTVVAEQAAWALGNIAGDGAATRDTVLAAGALPALLPALKTTATAQTLRTAVWTYSNFCRNKNPLVDFNLVAPALPYISELLEIEDADILADACWALSYLTDGPNDRIELVQMAPNLLVRLVKLLDHKSVAVKTPALRAVGNMVTGSDEQTDRCLDAGCLGYLNKLIQSGKPSLMKEACWAVSNVLAGTQAQIQRALDAQVLHSLVAKLQADDIKVQKEAAWAITNLCLGGSPTQLDVLFNSGFLVPYCSLLTSLDTKAVAVVLDGITHLLQAADKFGQTEALCLKLEEIGALDNIESLQNHENENIYKKTYHLIENYFSEHDDAEAQPTKTEEQYEFGTSARTNLQF